MPASRTFDREQISAIIMESIDLGLPVISTVVAVLGVSPNQARYMVRSVRDDGHLGAAPHHPARATIHRGSAGHKSWIVCEECTTNWPCPFAYPFGTVHKNQGAQSDEQPARRSRRSPRRSAAQRPRTERGGAAGIAPGQ